jgi:predicted cupin superfamily sugar epimerase
MDPDAAALIARLGLQPHPEGGFYREIFRSARAVQPYDARSRRSALTLIYFLLVDGAPSRWHQVASDEAWSWVAGAPLELQRIDPAFSGIEAELLGMGEGIQPAAVIAAGEWQAARSTGGWTLVTCAVGPGFDFQDFRMMSDDGEVVERVRQTLPDAAALI